MCTHASTLLAAVLALPFIVPPAGTTVTPERNVSLSALAERPLIVAQYDPCANGGCAEK